MVEAALWHGHATAANGAGLLVFIDDLTANRSSRMYSELLYILLTYSEMLLN